MRCFGTTEVMPDLMNQWFAPTRISLTFEQEGQGKFTEEEIRNLVERDASGRVIAVHLPSKAVLIANHQVWSIGASVKWRTLIRFQVYSDWWYVWCLTYFMGTHKDVFIVLKSSLKWVPLIGPVRCCRKHAPLSLNDGEGNANVQIHLSCAFMGL